jgi:hypothetical protein
MSYSYGATRYMTVSAEQISKICESEFKRFLSEFNSLRQDFGDDVDRALHAYEVYDDQFTDHLEQPQDEAEFEKLDERVHDLTAAYAALKTSFKNACGLDLYFGYEGDTLCGSDVCEESFWYVSGYYVVSAEAKAFEDKYGFVKEQWVVNGG